MANLSRCKGDHIFCKAKNIDFLALYRTSFLILFPTGFMFTSGGCVEIQPACIAYWGSWCFFVLAISNSNVGLGRGAGFTFPLSDLETRAPGDYFNLWDPSGTTPVQEETAQTAGPEASPALPAIVMWPPMAETEPRKKLGKMNLEPNCLGLTTYKASGSVLNSFGLQFICTLSYKESMDISFIPGNIIKTLSSNVGEHTVGLYSGSIYNLITEPSMNYTG